MSMNTTAKTTRQKVRTFGLLPSFENEASHLYLFLCFDFCLSLQLYSTELTLDLLFSNPILINST